LLQDNTIIYRFTGPFGVRVDTGQSLLLLGAFLLYGYLGYDLVRGVIFCVLLIGSIYLHELGHAWGCVVQDVPVRRIMLHGGGGFCERTRSATRHEQELIVAMGPIVNLAIWALAGLADHLLWAIWAVAATTLDASYGPLGFLSETLYLLGLINLWLFAFNMIPVQPLDGGKLLHLGMLRFLAPSAAHRATGAIGFAFALAWIPAMYLMYTTHGWIMFFIPSIMGHFNMMRGKLAF
jgi:Zn-dependent protease